MAKKILVVTKDIGEYNAIFPIVHYLGNHGEEVYILAEGLSKERWLLRIVAGKSGRIRWFVGGEGSSDIGVISNFVAYTDIDTVMCGLGSPINLAEHYGLAANNMGIPLIHVHDIWGVHSRSTAIPDLVLAPDIYAEKLVKEYAPYQSKLPKVVVTGFPAMDNLMDVETDETTVQSISERGRTVLFLGQDTASTTPALEGLIEGLGESVGDFILIPRLHPKIREGREKWLEMLSRVHGDVLWVRPNVSTRQLMNLVDQTVSVYSTGLIEAAMLGSLPISWMSPAGREMMKTNLGGIERFPLVDYGCCIEVNSVKEYPDFITCQTRDFQEIVAKNLPNDGKAAERCANAILEFIS